MTRTDPAKSNELTCRDVSEFLMAYLDNELPPETRSEFDAHLSICSSCLRYLEQYRRTVGLGREAFAESDDAAGGHVPTGMLEAIRAARKRAGIGGR